MTSSIEHDRAVAAITEQLAEIEGRLIPTGLHVFGRAAELKEKADLLRMVASFDRPEHDAGALPKLVANALGLDSEVLSESPANETKELIDRIVTESIARFCEKGADEAVAYLKDSANVRLEDTSRTFALLEEISQQLDSNQEIESLMRDPGIVRNRLKILSAVKNAKSFLEVQAECGSFDRYLWKFVGGKPMVNFRKTLSQIPVRTAESDALSKDLKKRGFSFVGSTICYALMQAVGMVNDHVLNCFRYRKV